ncbi:MAG: hypothetical protein KQA41_02305 [Candidatus Aenigmarchaeota archaeon]|nr:hypothetical protein [Candidatus Aenigmarchaeota archaeon]MBU5689034.1 hypothetical protein [Candidatus Aenigmarchaeota archaeon]
MKKIFIVLVLLLLAIFFLKYSFSQTPKITCSIETSCSYTGVFRISDLTDAHAELITQTNYPYVVCCRIDGASLSVSQEISGGFIGLSNPTDAHVEAGSQNNYGYHLEFNPSYGSIFCEVSDSCENYDTCLVSISDLTDAHVGDCTTNPYQKKICCSFGSLEININLNASKVEWNGGLKVWGKTTKNGAPLQNADVFVFINNELYCQIKTNSSGDYACEFNIKRNRIGQFIVFAKVIDPSNLKEKISYSTINVFIDFGFKEKGKNIVCEDIKKLIQNPDGSIEEANVKICTWK